MGNQNQVMCRDLVRPKPITAANKNREGVIQNPNQQIRPIIQGLNPIRQSPAIQSQKPIIQEQQGLLIQGRKTRVAGPLHQEVLRPAEALPPAEVLLPAGDQVHQSQDKLKLCSSIKLNQEP